MKLPASTLLVYALVFCTELGQSMLFPLLPMFADEFALSDAQTGAILAASTLATVAAALPAGLLAARRGARFVCVLAAGAIASSAARWRSSTPSNPSARVIGLVTNCSGRNEPEVLPSESSP